MTPSMPARDIETIQIELALRRPGQPSNAVASRVAKGRERWREDRQARTRECSIKLHPALEEFLPAESVSLTDDERAIARNFFLLTMKPTIYAANVDEATLASAGGQRSRCARFCEVAKRAKRAECLVICAQLEADLVGAGARRATRVSRIAGR